MNQEKKDASELFYSIFASIKPPEPRSTSPQDEWQSHVSPHGEIEALAPNLWHVSGTLPSATMVPREMVLYRLADGSLLIHSAIALNEAEMAKLESLGKPKIAIVPNRIHRFDAGTYKQRYPQLIVVCPAAAKPYVEEMVGNKCDRIERIFRDYRFGQAVFYDRSRGLPSVVRIIRNENSIISASSRSPALQARIERSTLLKLLNCHSLADSIPNLQVISVAHGSPIIADCSDRLREAAARLR